MAKEKETKAKAAKKTTKTTKKAESKAVKKVVKEKKTKDSMLYDEDDIESLDSIKARLLKKAKADGGEIEQAEIQDAISFLDLDDKDVDDLINYFKSNSISIICN